jgi:hypothetical protein
MAGRQGGAASRRRYGSPDRRPVRRAHGAGSKRLGEEGLLELARSLASLPGPAFVDALVDGAEMLAREHGGLRDDIAVVRVERTAN